MYTLTIKLKQHTPLIHFQHDQDGATLRASEVKPKLDKYILGKLNQEEKKQGESEGWIKGKGKDKEWLDYKMSIKASGKPREYLVASLFDPRSIVVDGSMVQERDLPFTIIRESPFFAQESINSDNRTYYKVSWSVRVYVF